MHANAVTGLAKVAELVDALDLGSSAARRESSSLSFRTIHLEPYKMYGANFKIQGFKINNLKCITSNEASFTGGLYCLGKPLFR
jgi:hypothetical protein